MTTPPESKIPPSPRPGQLRLALVGNKRSGKDTVAEMLGRLVPGLAPEAVPIAGPLKAAATLFFPGLEERQLHGANEFTERADEANLGGATPRDLLVELGRYLAVDLPKSLRMSGSRAVLMDACLAQCRSLYPYPVVVTDVRRREEMEALRAAGFTLIGVRRPSTEAAALASGSRTEVQVPSLLAQADYLLLNDGTLQDLERKVGCLWRRLQPLLPSSPCGACSPHPPPPWGGRGRQTKTGLSPPPRIGERMQLVVICAEARLVPYAPILSAALDAGRFPNLYPGVDRGMMEPMPPCKTIRVLCQEEDRCFPGAPHVRAVPGPAVALRDRVRALAPAPVLLLQEGGPHWQEWLVVELLLDRVLVVNMSYFEPFLGLAPPPPRVTLAPVNFNNT